MTATFEYTAELQLNDGSLVPIDLEQRGWAEPERLANTRVFTLIPKDPTSRWPLLRIHIPEGAKPVFKTRMNIGITAGYEIRVYAAGWFKDGENHWTWLFPNGAMERETDDPTLNDLLTHAMNDAWRAQLPTGK
jgi:hypothetical protein